MVIFSHSKAGPVLCTGARTAISLINTLRPRQNGRRFADDNFKRIFLNENVRISIKISLKFVPKGPINNNPSLVQIMAWRRPGDKPLSEAMVVSLPTHICVTRSQWVNTTWSIRDAIQCTPARSSYSITSAMASQITSPTIINPTIYSGAYQGKHRSSASLAFAMGIHQWPVNSRHKGPVRRDGKCFLLMTSSWWLSGGTRTTKVVL